MNTENASKYKSKRVYMHKIQQEGAPTALKQDIKQKGIKNVVMYNTRGYIMQRI
jgi:hypothetical protein